MKGKEISRPHSEALSFAKFIHSRKRAEFGSTLLVGGGWVGSSLLNSFLIVSILSVESETATSLPWRERFAEWRKGLSSIGECKWGTSSGSNSKLGGYAYYFV